MEGIGNGLAGALRLVQETACRAQAAEILAVDDPHSYHVRIGDELMKIDRMPPPREHAVHDIPSLCRVVKQFGATGASVWHCHHGIVAILDGFMRRDCVTLVLAASDQMEALVEIDARVDDRGRQAGMDQRAFVNALKLRLDVDETFVGQFRRLDWRQEQTAHGTAARGQDRMGKAVSAEVNGVADLPETLALEIPVYCLAGVHYRYKIACHIDIDAAQQKLSLVSVPGAIKLAIDAAQADLRRLLEVELGDGGTEIFYGRP